MNIYFYFYFDYFVSEHDHSGLLGIMAEKRRIKTCVHTVEPTLGRVPAKMMPKRIVFNSEMYTPTIIYNRT